jgi:hypothetical protein
VDISITIQSSLRHRLGDSILVPGRGTDYSLRHRFQIDPGAQPASSPCVTALYFPKDKADGA